MHLSDLEELFNMEDMVELIEAIESRSTSGSDIARRATSLAKGVRSNPEGRQLKDRLGPTGRAVNLAKDI